ncbi:MAG: hypothetical protein ACPG7F_16840 [Aggregatilineales bacterium]
MSHDTTTNIIVSFDNVRMKDFRAYWAAIARGDWQAQDAFFAKVVQTWDFDHDPADPASYADLPLTDYHAVQRAIRQKSQAVSSTMRGSEDIQ